MNIQTEHLEDHTARFTVEIDAERLDRAKEAAARSLSKRVSIPGFRKGKAPYRILVQYIGEANILQDALEELSQEVYRETIDQVDIEPYGPGSWDNFELTPVPTFVYTVPLQPTVTLENYRSVRLDYVPPTVDDAAVDEAMKQLQQEEALVEESSRPVEIGSRVVVDIHSEFADAPVASSDEAAAEHVPSKGDVFAHEHDATIMLGADDEPIMRGFKAALLGANAGDTVEFELVIPDDDPDYKEVAGRTVQFHVTIKRVEIVTLPAMNDDFAARVSQGEPEPLTLLQLRMQLREKLQNAAERQERSAYSNRVLSMIVAGAKIAYPEAMVNEQIDAMFEDLKLRVKQQGLSIDTYYKVTSRTEADIRNDYRQPAEDTIKRMLVLRELIQAEKLQVSEDQILQRIEEIAAQFGEQAEMFKGLLDTPQMRVNLQNELLEQIVFDRIFAIGRDEAPPLPEMDVPEVNEALAAPEVDADAAANT